ncbi:MAG TPA: peptide deformylase [Candidatus Saccharimonadales bacterium]|nr:peptide deformylase [Candidatus Saccharimonadales bacterium]
MAIKKIVQIPDPILTTPTKKVSKIDDEAKKTIQDLLDTLSHAHDPEGAGIAAPQIGSNLRICIVRRFTKDPNNPEIELTKDHILVNPKITDTSTETQVSWEGCLSIPDTYGRVPRFKKIKVKAQNENGEDVKYNATGFFGRVMQHEIDHLDGVLFTSRTVGKVLNEKELDDLYDKEEDDE